MGKPESWLEFEHPTLLLYPFMLMLELVSGPVLRDCLYFCSGTSTCVAPAADASARSFSLILAALPRSSRRK